jgi:predicted nucleotidyltransferase
VSTEREREPAAAVEAALRAYFAAERPAGVVAAFLFGSVADRTDHSESDVDVAVLLEYGAFPDRTSRSRAAVALGTALIAVVHRNAMDVVVLNDAPPELAAAVVTSGVRLHCADADAERAFTRDALLRYADVRPFLERTRRLKLQALAR